MVILHRHNVLEGPQVICDPVGYFVPDADWHARAFKGGHGGDGIMTSRIIQIKIYVALSNHVI